jgi:hypothetical protein
MTAAAAAVPPSKIIQSNLVLMITHGKMVSNSEKYKCLKDEYR